MKKLLFIATTIVTSIVAFSVIPVFAGWGYTWEGWDLVIYNDAWLTQYSATANIYVGGQLWDSIYVRGGGGIDVLKIQARSSWDVDGDGTVSDDVYVTFSNSKKIGGL